jgi:cytochrome c-type biogenesis protein CcmH/NrfF
MRGIALAALVIALTTGSVSAQEDPEVAIARSAHELARELMSPYCPGRTLEACPSPDALAVREEIRAALRAGEPADSIRKRIEERFGAAVVGLPETPLGRALPVALLALGALALAVALRRLVRSR